MTPGPAPTVLHATTVHKTFPTRGEEVEILHGVDLTVEAGEMVSIVGPSGSGKSTLLYCLAGLEPLSAGTITISGSTLGTLTPRRLARLRRDHIGFVFQSYNLIPSLTVADNVALPTRLARRRVTTSDITAALAAVGLADLAHTRPEYLSGGQQQRVAIARALFSRPDIIFADEPTGALDAASGGAVLNLLRAATDTGSAVLMVTHDLDAAARADRAIVLRDGSIRHHVTSPTAAQLFDLVTAAS